MQAYVKDVRQYAQVEFKRGASEQDVYNSVNQAGVSLPALRSVINREYLGYIGVTEGNIRAVRFVGMFFALVFYAIVAPHIISDSPFYRYAMPACMAVGIFFGIEALATKFWKWRRKPNVNPE
jgi:hypothetical protein